MLLVWTGRENTKCTNPSTLTQSPEKCVGTEEEASLILVSSQVKPSRFSPRPLNPSPVKCVGTEEEASLLVESSQVKPSRVNPRPVNPTPMKVPGKRGVGFFVVAVSLNKTHLLEPMPLHPTISTLLVKIHGSPVSHTLKTLQTHRLHYTSNHS